MDTPTSMPDATDAALAEDLFALALADAEPVAAATAAILRLKDGECLWSIGEPDHWDFRFCGAPRRAGRPYCRRHARMAIQPQPRR